MKNPFAVRMATLEAYSVVAACVTAWTLTADRQQKKTLMLLDCLVTLVIGGTVS